MTAAESEDLIYKTRSCSEKLLAGESVYETCALADHIILLPSRRFPSHFRVRMSSAVSPRLHPLQFREVGHQARHGGAPS